RDIAAGILAASVKGRTGERYILGGHPMTYQAAFQLFSDAAGRSKKARTAPAWLVRTSGRAAGLLGAVTGGEYDVNSASAEMSILPHHFSSAKAVEELGYSFRPVEDAARDAWEWFTANAYA
nr:NAD-dependent dehydratase [Gemmatimonadaceae bacterium]